MNQHRDLIERIKREVDIRRLLPHPVAGSGGVIMIRCPFPGHEDKHPSCAIYITTNSWYCFSHPGKPCGGSVIDFVMHLHGLDFWGAVRFLVDFMGWTLDPPTKEERVAMETRHKREETLSALVRYAHGQLIANSDTATKAREYLTGRGFTAMQVEEHRIGLLNLETLHRVVATHPVLEGFHPEDFAAAGLRRESGALLFCGTRIVFPLLEGQRVVGMTFRALPGSSDKAKFIHLADQPAGLWNVDALRNPDRKVVVAEGVPDALTLAGWGIPAVGNLGLQVAKNAHRFEHLKEVTVVFDNDAAGQGRVLTAARALQGALKDGVVKVLTLPGEKDVNDWARAGGTKEDFQALVAKAPNVVDTMISALPSTAKGLRDEDLQPVLSAIRLMPELSWESYGGDLATHIHVNPHKIQRLLTLMDRQRPKTKNKTKSISQAPTGKPSSAYLPKRLIQVRPGLDVIVVEGFPTLNMGMVMQHRFEEDDEDASEHDFMLTRELLTVTAKPSGVEVHMVLHKPDVKPEHDMGGFPDVQFPHWSDDPTRPRSLMAFLDDPGMTESGYRLYQDIRSLLADFVFLEDGRELDLITIWIMMTYVYPVFYTVGFLHFHGGKGTGKTTVLDLIDLLSFNAEKSANPTEASASFHPHNASGTLIVDETEHLRNPRPGTREALVLYIYIISYKKGAVQTKGNAEMMQSVVRYLYGPKCFGSINGLNYVLGDRCITIHTRLADSNTVQLKDRQHEDAAVRSLAADLRDRLHVWACTHFGELHALVTGEMRTAHRPRLPNRLRELWLPLITIARAIDREKGSSHRLEDLLLELEALKRTEAQAVEAEENPRLLYLKMLAQLLEDHALDLCASNAGGHHPGWYSPSILVTEIEKVLHNQRGLPLYVQRDAKWLRNLLVDERVVDKKDKKQIRVSRDGQPSAHEYCYRIDRDVLAAALTRLNLHDKEGDDDGRYLVAPFVAPPGGSASPGRETMAFELGDALPF